MLYFTANSRDGRSSGSSTCNTCCCETITMVPSETNKVTINYAPWSLPIGELIGGPTLSLVTNTAGCATAAVDGVLPPTNENYVMLTPINTAVTQDLTVRSLPVGNFPTFAILPQRGAEHGVVTIAGSIVTYTPATGYEGFDSFWFTTTDLHGRVTTNAISVEVGSTIGAPPREETSLVPYINYAKIKTDIRNHIVSFSLHMSLACRACETYKLTWEQKARDCDGNIFDHVMCFEIRCGGC